MGETMKAKPEFELAKRFKGPSQMERVRAARALINGRHSDSEALALRGFLAIFHPEMSDDKVRELVRDVRDQRQRS